MHAIAAVLALAGAAMAQTGSSGYLTKPMPTGTGAVYTTVTVCPTPTAFVCEGTTYSATKPSQTITLTCNVCSISPVTTTPIVKTGPAPTAASTTTTPPATYTGAAERVQVGGAMIAAAIGLMAL